MSLNNQAATAAEEADRRAAMKETLPGLLFGIFTIVTVAGIIIWLVINAG